MIRICNKSYNIILKRDGIFFFSHCFTTILNKIISFITYMLIQDSINGTFETKFTFLNYKNVMKQ